MSKKSRLSLSTLEHKLRHTRSHFYTSRSFAHETRNSPNYFNELLANNTYNNMYTYKQVVLKCVPSPTDACTNSQLTPSDYRHGHLVNASLATYLTEKTRILVQ